MYGLSNVPSNVVCLSDTHSDRVAYAAAHTAVIYDKHSGTQTFLQVISHSNQQHLSPPRWPHAVHLQTLHPRNRATATPSHACKQQQTGAFWSQQMLAQRPLCLCSGTPPADSPSARCSSRMQLAC